MGAFELRPLPKWGKQIELLLGPQARALFASFGLTPGGARKPRVGLMVGAVVLMLVMSLAVMTYLFAFGFVMGRSGEVEAIPAAAVLVGALPALAITMLKANGALFGLRDYDLIMSMPTSTHIVVLSRIVPLYLVELASAVVTMLPLYFAYALSVPVTAGRLGLMLASVLLVPLTPTCAATVLSFLISMLVSRFRRFRTLSLALGAVLVAGGLYGYLWLSFSFSSPDSDGMALLAHGLSGLVQVLSQRLWPLAAWFAGAMAGSLSAGCLFFGVSLVIPFASLEFLARHFMALNSVFLARGGRHNPKAIKRGWARSSGPFRALLAKELGCLVGTPACVFNILASDLMLLGAALFLAFFAPRDLATLSVNGVELSQLSLFGTPNDLVRLVAPWSFALFSLSVPFAACSTSLEGRAAWVMSCAPQPVRIILGAKMLASMVHLVVTAMISAVLLALTGRIEPLVAFECVLAMVSYGYLAAAIGLFVDVRSPNYAWSSPAEVVKRGAPVTAAILSGMAVMALSSLVVASALFAVGPDTSRLAYVGIEALMIVVGTFIFSRACRQPLYL